jgi:acyl-CoA thioesterase-1
VNDALRGTSAEDAERGLRRVVADARAAGARVLLVGVSAPPPLATAHTRRFEAIYARLAADERVAFVPDLMAGAAGDPGQMFPDGLHPNGAGQRRLADNVRPVLEQVLAEVDAARRGPDGRQGAPR